MTDTIYLTKNDLEVLKRLEETEARTSRTLAAAAWSSILYLVRVVVTRKLLGQYLNRVTGTGIRSITASPSVESRTGRAWATMGTNLGYMVRHDQGYSGVDHIPAYTRRSLGGKIVRVRAHERRVFVRARHFFRDTFGEGVPGVEARLQQGIRILLRTGQVPTAGEIQRGA